MKDKNTLFIPTAKANGNSSTVIQPMEIDLVILSDERSEETKDDGVGVTHFFLSRANHEYSEGSEEYE